MKDYVINGDISLIANLGWLDVPLILKRFNGELFYIVNEKYKDHPYPNKSNSKLNPFFSTIFERKELEYFCKSKVEELTEDNFIFDFSDTRKAMEICINLDCYERDIHLLNEDRTDFRTYIGEDGIEKKYKPYSKLKPEHRVQKSLIAQASDKNVLIKINL